jgi:hypothetical protein
MADKDGGDDDVKDPSYKIDKYRISKESRHGKIENVAGSV